MNTLKRTLNLFLTLTSIIYPLCWFFLPQYRMELVALFAGLWTAKVFTSQGNMRYFAGLLAIVLWSLFALRTLELMTWYPAIVSGLMLIIFASSLFTSQSFVERIARLKEPNLPPAGVIYTRRVTQVWCVFFLANILVIAVSIWQEFWLFWALYSGIISYLLMGMLFLGEWLVRRRILKP